MFFLTIDKSWNSQEEIASWIALDIKTYVFIWHLLWQMVLHWGVNLQVILKAFEVKFVEKLGA